MNKDIFNSSNEKRIVEIKNNVYQNNLFNISFQIPKGWYVIQVEEFNKIATKQKFKESAEFLKDYIFEKIGSPCLVTTKYDPNSDELDDIISPTIHFTINPKENEDPNITINEYADLIDLSEDECVLNNYMVVKKGDIFIHNDYNSIIYETEYLFEHPELKKPEMVEMFFLYIEYDNFFLEFSMTQCANQGEIATQVFNDFRKSITLG